MTEIGKGEAIRLANRSGPARMQTSDARFRKASTNLSCIGSKSSCPLPVTEMNKRLVMRHRHCETLSTKFVMLRLPWQVFRVILKQAADDSSRPRHISWHLINNGPVLAQQELFVRLRLDHGTAMTAQAKAQEQAQHRLAAQDVQSSTSQTANKLGHVPKAIERLNAVGSELVGVQQTLAAYGSALVPPDSGAIPRRLRQPLRVAPPARRAVPSVAPAARGQ